MNKAYACYLGVLISKRIDVGLAYPKPELQLLFHTHYNDADQRKHQSSTSLTFVMGIHRWPGYFPHKGPVTQKTVPFDDVIMQVTHNNVMQRACFVQHSLVAKFTNMGQIGDFSKI